jgi:death-on-curing protein
LTRYPTVAETVAVHARLIARFGGSGGIRDHAALESALARSRSGYYSDLIQEAAALWESLSQNHAFVDGNKRVAVTVTAAFLRVNGYRLEFDDFGSALNLCAWI